MALKIPKQIYPDIDGKKELERIMRQGSPKKKSRKRRGSNTNEPFEFKNANIVKSDYIQIPGLNKVISKFEIPNYNNLDWEQTHFKIQENGLYMPLIPEFMKHFTNVLNCYKNKKPLFDGAGNPVSEKEKEDIYLHLTKDHIAVYGGVEGAWTWLDAKFKDGKILSEHRISKDKDGKKILKPNKVEDLEDCLMKDCYVNFKKLNSQGLPTAKTKSQRYELGSNIYFCFPRDSTVAGFNADSDRALLYCFGGPSYRCANLGVFAIARVKK